MIPPRVGLSDLTKQLSLNLWPSIQEFGVRFGAGCVCLNYIFLCLWLVNIVVCEYKVIEGHRVIKY
jgi:hypothetical protein